MSLYPKASYLGDGISGGSFIAAAPKRIIIHTTETEGIPKYSDGKSSPHLTYYVQKNRWVQHTPFDRASRALKNVSGGVQTNRQGAIQIEVVCYSNKPLADQKPSRLWVGNLPAYAYRSIAAAVAWLVEHYDVSPYVRLPRPKPRSGVDSPARMGADEWNSFNGLAGHFEAPENDHWDPGAFDFIRLLEEVGEIMEPKVPFEDQVSEWAVESWRKAFHKGIVRDNTVPSARMTKEEFMVFLDRLGLLD